MVIQNLASIYLLKVNNRNTKKKVWNMFKVNNKATKTTLILNIFHTFVLVFLLLTLNMWLPADKNEDCCHNANIFCAFQKGVIWAAWKHTNLFVEMME